MFTNVVEKFGESLENSLINGKEMVLLAKVKGSTTYYRVKEYVCFLRKIEICKQKSEMKTLKIIFASGVELSTGAYIDETIKENSFVSIVGYINKYNDELQFRCKAGVERVFAHIANILVYRNVLDLAKSHKIQAITNLSVAEESEKYNNVDNIFPFGDTNLYYTEQEFKVKAPTVTDPEALQKLIETSPKIEQEQQYYDEIDDPIIDIEDLEDKCTNIN